MSAPAGEACINGSAENISIERTLGSYLEKKGKNYCPYKEVFPCDS